MFQPSSPLVNISASVGHGAYALGYQTAFDAGRNLLMSRSSFNLGFSGKSALTKHNLAVAYNAGDMIIHGTANDSKVSLHLLHLQLHLLFCSHLR